MTLDLLALIPIGAVVALLIAVLKVVPEGTAGRYMAGRHYHRTGQARHARREPTAVTTIPDVRPLTARTAT